MTVDSIRVQVFDGAAAITLATGQATATFVPDLGMLGASLRWGGHEYVNLQGGLIRWSQGHTTGIPLLHPWANRLSSDRYEALGRTVDLSGLDLHADANGLPMHGTMIARRGWEVVDLGHRDGGPSIWARFRYADDDALTAAFPFPHLLDLKVLLGHDPTGSPRLVVKTTVLPLAGVEVPISFGWHPYLTVPGVERDQWKLSLPARHHLALDERGIPTGEEEAEPAEVVSLADLDLDDAYRLATGEGRPSFVLTGGLHTVTVRFDEGYSHAQLYSPERKPFVAVEPMTAPVDALHAGSYPVATFETPYSATFTVLLG